MGRESAMTERICVYVWCGDIPFLFFSRERKSFIKWNRHLSESVFKTRFGMTEKKSDFADRLEQR